MSPQNFKNVSEVSHVVGCYLTLPELWLKHTSHHFMVCGPRVLHTERHDFVMVVFDGSEKGCFFLVARSQCYLMVSLESIQEAHSGVACGCIYQLIYLRHQEQIFWASFIQISEVYTNSPFSALLLYHYSVSQPLRIKNFLDCSRFLKLHRLVPNSVGMLFQRAPRGLFLRGDGWVNV